MYKELFKNVIGVKNNALVQHKFQRKCFLKFKDFKILVNIQIKDCCILQFF